MAQVIITSFYFTSIEEMLHKLLIYTIWMSERMAHWLHLRGVEPVSICNMHLEWSVKHKAGSQYCPTKESNLTHCKALKNVKEGINFRLLSVFS